MIITQATINFIQEANAPWRADWLWGCPLIVLTVIFHVLCLGYVSQKSVLIYSDVTKRHHPIAALVVVIGAATLVATLLHALEAGMWAIAYRLVGALPDGKAAMLYSLGAMTTYGHQNLFLEKRWQVMGTIEALNGWLLFGMSTAFLFWVIQEVSPSHRARV